MKNYAIRILILYLITTFISGCMIWSHQSTGLPPISKPSYLDLKTENKGHLEITLVNQLPVDRYIIFRSGIDSVQDLLDRFNPIILNAYDSLSFSMFAGIDSLDYDNITRSLSGSSYIGNPGRAKPDLEFSYELPVKKGASYKILQGQDGSFTHNTVVNKFAVDIAMPVGDTVYAARGGIVGYAFEESSLGGNDLAYMNYDNIIMIHHEDGTVAQYSHLMQNGVLVEIGDNITMGQPIALSGNTGFVSGDHLHFNVFKPSDTGPISVFISFKGYEDQRFEKGDQVSH
jgi:hypothetical protein